MGCCRFIQPSCLQGFCTAETKKSWCGWTAAGCYPAWPGCQFVEPSAGMIV